jgi:hypothetical protein
LAGRWSFAVTDDNGKTSLPDVAKLAVAGIAVITAVTGIVGSVTGGVARPARNAPLVLPLATGVIFGAVALALVAAIGIVFQRWPGSPFGASGWSQIVLVSLSLVGLGLAGTLVASRLSGSLAIPDRPVVSDAKSGAARRPTVGVDWNRQSVGTQGGRSASGRSIWDGE